MEKGHGDKDMDTKDTGAKEFSTTLSLTDLIFIKVKRALNLDAVQKNNLQRPPSRQHVVTRHFVTSHCGSRCSQQGTGAGEGGRTSDATPLKARMSNLNFYSPTTGTCQLSPCSSPTCDRAQGPSSAPAQGDGNEQSNSRSGLSRRGQPQTEDDVFLQLQSQALEGSRELGNILGVSHSSCDLSAELQKSQALVSQAEKLQLLKENYGKVPARDL
ncbi:hypothetical protein DV515_00004660 [Chloebia gouldiae]|uniref:Uncharacterized protein n=1 Tax=Chloebia gouldiae TaxID=44316 RepID=A0A3L8SP41_CHLGU|nr:hypothetical protein DV515_00004660 [Chloebia gouldiae]